MKKYLIYSFKRKLPLFVILFVLFLTFALVSANNINFVRTIYEGSHYYYEPDGGFLGLVIALFITMTFLPLFGMNYRYSLSKSDTFRQAAFKDKHIRYGEHLLNLIITLVLFSISFLVLVLILMARNAAIVLPQSIHPEISYELIKFNYIYYLPLYFATIALAILHYFICYLLISRSNNLLNSLIILSLGQSALGVFILLPVSFFIDYSVGVNALYSNASIFFPISYLYCQFNPLIARNVNSFADIFSPINDAGITKEICFIIGFASFIIISLVGVAAFILEKDPSGEWANKPKNDKLYQEIIYHVSFALIGSVIGVALVNAGIIWYLLFFILFSSTYYTLYGLLNRNFALKPKQIITLGSVTLLAILISVIYFIIYNNAK